MTDYSQMSDEQINRLVAERLGYTCEEEQTYWPNTEIVWRDQRGMKIDHLALAHDLNQAIDLLRQIDGSLSLTIFGKAWDVTCPDPDSISGNRLISVEHSNPARAICEAWLQWKDG